MKIIDTYIYLSNLLDNESPNEVVETITLLKAHLKSLLTAQTLDSNLKESTISNIRFELNAAIKEPRYAKMIIDNKPAVDLFYTVLIALTDAEPFNNRSENGLLWICPISLQEFLLTTDTGTFTLTTGYRFERKALLKWFDTSGEYVCPATKKPLPKFDIDRIKAAKTGLSKIEELRIAYEHKKSALLTEQEAFFSRTGLSLKEKIQKDYIKMTSMHAHDDEYKQIKQKILNNIGILYNQRQSKPTDSIIEMNLSNVDFSNIYLDACNIFNDFRGANFSNAVFFAGVSIKFADFTEANLEFVRFLGVPGSRYICVKNTNFTRANLRNADLTGLGEWETANFTEANLIDAYLYTEDGIMITGNALKKHFKGCPGIESAVCVAEQNNSNNTNNTNYVSNSVNNDNCVNLEIKKDQDNLNDSESSSSDESSAYISDSSSTSEEITTNKKRDASLTSYSPTVFGSSNLSNSVTNNTIPGPTENSKSDEKKKSKSLWGKFKKKFSKHKDKKNDKEHDESHDKKRFFHKRK